MLQYRWGWQQYSLFFSYILGSLCAVCGWLQYTWQYTEVHIPSMCLVLPCALVHRAPLCTVCACHVLCTTCFNLLCLHLKRCALARTQQASLARSCCPVAVSYLYCYCTMAFCKQNIQNITNHTSVPHINYALLHVLPCTALQEDAGDASTALYNIRTAACTAATYCSCTAAAHTRTYCLQEDAEPVSYPGRAGCGGEGRA